MGLSAFFSKRPPFSLPALVLAKALAFAPLFLFSLASLPCLPQATREAFASIHTRERKRRKNWFGTAALLACLSFLFPFFPTTTTKAHKKIPLHCQGCWFSSKAREEGTLLFQPKILEKAQRKRGRRKERCFEEGKAPPAKHEGEEEEEDDDAQALLPSCLPVVAACLPACLFLCSENAWVVEVL